MRHTADRPRRARRVGSALVASSLLVAPRIAPAQTAEQRVRAAIATMPPEVCASDRPAEVWETRMAVVVYADGNWALAMGPYGAFAPVPPSRVRAYEECVARTLSLALPQPVAPAPRRTLALPHGWTHDDAARSALRDRIAALTGDVLACARPPAQYARRSVPLRIERARDGRARVSTNRDDELAPRVARCAESALGVIPPIVGVVEHSIVVSEAEPAMPRERVDGSEGALCGWGERRADATRRPRPAPCRSGLRCCTAGGAAGSDSVCMALPDGRCPAYP